MKNRKTVVVAFMLCAVMLLGVGYAALSDVLDIQGTAQVTQGNAQNAFDGDVYFSAVSLVVYSAKNISSLRAMTLQALVSAVSAATLTCLTHSRYSIID